MLHVQNLNSDAGSAKVVRGVKSKSLRAILMSAIALTPAMYGNAAKAAEQAGQGTGVEEIIVTELGTRLSKVFSKFNTEPIAAASLGQTHHAVLIDGREVAVKVQRPGIRASTIRDLEALADIAEFFDHHTKAGKRYETSTMLDEFRKSLLAELDYRKEAHNLMTMRENLKEFEKKI